jgi:hypothetical protein
MLMLQYEYFVKFNGPGFFKKKCYKNIRSPYFLYLRTDLKGLFFRDRFRKC